MDPFGQGSRGPGLNTKADPKAKSSQWKDSVQELLGILLRIQELGFALMEHDAAESQKGKEEIRKAREELAEGVPLEWLRVLERLQNTGQPAVVPATGGFCSYCRIQVPTRMYQEVIANSRIHQCPCCARILYVPEGGGLHLTDSTPRTAAEGFARFSNPQLVLPNLLGRTMPEVLQEIVGRLSCLGWIAQPQEILRAAIQREELVTTALEHGLAFPHVRGVEGGGLVVAVGLSRKGVHFSPGGRRLTRILFFSVIPQAASSLYLKIVGGLVKALRTDEARKTLLSCQDSSKAWEVLLQLSGPTLP